MIRRLGLALTIAVTLSVPAGAAVTAMPGMLGMMVGGFSAIVGVTAHGFHCL